MTATFGATARAVASEKGLIDDPFAEALVRAVGVGYFVQVIDNQQYGGGDPVVAALMDVLVTHTRFLDQFLAAAGRAGIRQAVILASGLDTRPYRLWWPPGTTVYEVDQPEVIDFKTAVLRGLGATLSANRCAVGVDLRQDWLAALQRVGFDDAQPTVWIVEQLLIGYLPPSAQNRLLDDITALSAPGSRFAADHMPTWSVSQLAAGQAFMAVWRRHGLDVDLTSLTYPGEYRYVPEYLVTHGWQTVERDVVGLFSAMGLAGRWHGNDSDVDNSPKYVTATRV